MVTQNTLIINMDVLVHYYKKNLGSPYKKDSYLLWLSGYINGNPEIHKICKAENWLWSSYRDYLGLRNGTLCHKIVVLNQFNSMQGYKNLVKLIIRESSQRKDEIKKYLLE